MAEPTRNAVLVVDDEPASVQLLRITLGLNYDVYTATSGAAALEILERHPNIGVALIDQRMPEMTGTEFIRKTIPAHPDLVRIILTGYTDIESLIEAINAGHVFRYITKPWNKDELLATVRQGFDLYGLARENMRLQEELRAALARLAVENAHLKREARGRHRFSEIAGSSPALQSLFDLVERVVPTHGTVLILGETGTGKELVARAIHYNGPRADRAFVTENCGALAPELLTSELFGYRRGAFTGATEDRKGLFEVADGGTLFLDEIGDCPADLQTRFLRVLDQREIRRVGDATPIEVDVRIIAATHHDLEQDVAAGTFRRDLFYRLNVFTLRVPPLRERREDIPLLAHHFLERLSRAHTKPVRGITEAALELLSRHDYPGNVRELENEIERAVALAETDGYITPDLLSEKFHLLADECPPPIAQGTLRHAVDQFEAQAIREALARCNGNQTHAAVDLGLSRRTLIDKIEKYRLREKH